MKSGSRLFALLLLSVSLCSSIDNIFAQVAIDDSLALVSLYNNTEGPSWGHTWQLDQPIKTWYGVHVAGNRVDSLNLQNNRLSGTIPSSLGNLDQLKYLNLSANYLEGNIPITIWKLTKLIHLSLFQNHLTGTLPSDIGNLSRLEYLNLSGNELSGQLPSELWTLTQLTYLSFNGNKFKGSISSEIGNLSALQYLDLSGFYLAEFGFSGEIPASIGQLVHLKKLYLKDNKLTGAIPSEIGQLINLEGLYLSGNHLTDSIPSGLGNLHHLKVLSLASNNLSGSIPAAMGEMDSLLSVYLNNNDLEGAVPQTISALKHLEILWLFKNHLTDLPDLSAFTNLKKLYVDNNQLTFEDILPNLSVASQTFRYAPQDSVGSTQYVFKKTGERFDLSVSVAGEGNQYQWFKDSVEIDGQDSQTLTILHSNIDDTGDYVCRITNYLATDLTLWSYPFHVTIAEPSLKLDSLALAAFYKKTGGDSTWENTNNWLKTPLTAGWYGVTIEGNRVTRLNLSNNGLSGRLPEEIGYLDSLKYLNLCFNALLDTLPEELWNLKALEDIRLYYNKFSGTISENIGNLSRLKMLKLNDNQLTGPIPETIGNLQNLNALDLNSNQLSGSIPASIGNLIHLGNLYLQQNKLEGHIPPELGNCHELHEINFYKNTLSGTIPETIFGLTHLTHLNLSWNPGLGGSLSEQLGSLTSLTHLYLSSCNFSGSLPNRIGSFETLTNINLSYNDISGSIPASYGNYTKLSQLSMDNNHLSGALPLSLGNLSTLQILSLSGNDFAGAIPDTIWRLTNLIQLSLANDNWTQEFPEDISRLIQLTNLYLDGNNLYGAVPESINKLVNLKYLFVDHNQLSALPHLDSLIDLRMLKIQNNHFTFEDIEPNVTIPSNSFYYAPQDSVGNALDTLLQPGENLDLSVSVGGTHNQYQWYLNGHVVDGATDSTYHISSASVADSGSYYCEITNTLATDLTLYSRKQTVHVKTGVGINPATSAVPRVYALAQNYPNPFGRSPSVRSHSSTVIRYQLPVHAHVQLAVYDALGKQIAVLINKTQMPGHYQATFESGSLSSGVYFYTLRAGTFIRTKKMLILR